MFQKRLQILDYESMNNQGFMDSIKPKKKRKRLLSALKMCFKITKFLQFQVAKQPKLEPLFPQEALPVDPLPCKDEQELNLVVKELLHQIKKDLNGKPMEQKIGQKKKDRKRGTEKKEIKLILTDG